MAFLLFCNAVHECIASCRNSSWSYSCVQCTACDCAYIKTLKNPKNLKLFLKALGFYQPWSKSKRFWCPKQLEAIMAALIHDDQFEAETLFILLLKSHSVCADVNKSTTIVSIFCLSYFMQTLAYLIVPFLQNLLPWLIWSYFSPLSA